MKHRDENVWVFCGIIKMKKRGPERVERDTRNTFSSFIYASAQCFACSSAVKEAKKKKNSRTRKIILTNSSKRESFSLFLKLRRRLLLLSLRNY